MGSYPPEEFIISTATTLLVTMHVTQVSCCWHTLRFYSLDSDGVIRGGVVRIERKSEATLSYLLRVK